jgi:hypothetical protein
MYALGVNVLRPSAKVFFSLDCVIRKHQLRPVDFREL